MLSLIETLANFSNKYNNNTRAFHLHVSPKTNSIIDLSWRNDSNGTCQNNSPETFQKNTKRSFVTAPLRYQADTNNYAKHSF